jgi:hypothetical protein
LSQNRKYHSFHVISALHRRSVLWLNEDRVSLAVAAIHKKLRRHVVPLGVATYCCYCCLTRRRDQRRCVNPPTVDRRGAGLKALNLKLVDE